MNIAILKTLYKYLNKKYRQELSMNVLIYSTIQHNVFIWIKSVNV